MGTTSDEPRARLGQELLRVHHQLRARLAALESTLDAEGADPVAFRTSCLAFCRALRRHHIGEDEGAFGVLRRHDPGLGEVLDALVADHEFLDPMLDRMQVLLDDARAGGDPAAVERELAGISAVLENHLAYEERTLVTVLDQLTATAGSPEERALRSPLDAVFESADS